MQATTVQQWMRALPDHVPLQLLSIPGTHNSPAYHRALPSVRCQIVSPLEQLERGVRFLDVRLQVDDPNDATSDSLSLVHGAFAVALLGSRKFRKLCDDVVGFLKRHSSETVILSLKREGRGNATDVDLARKLHDHYISEENWILEPGIPTLGEARGKVVLLRRFHLSEASTALYSRARGIDAEAWSDNSPNMLAGDVHVQDCYKILHHKDIERKLRHIYGHYDRTNESSRLESCTTEKLPLILNYLNASNFWKRGCWPGNIAAQINPAVDHYLCEMAKSHNFGRRGITVMDWIGKDENWSLVNTIVASNNDMHALQHIR